MKTFKTALHKSGFAPLVYPGSRVLILGSMPGEKSLAQQEYYAHPRNLFWPFMSMLKDEAPPATYDRKRDLLNRLGIALWDVCDACIRKGSLDTAIEQEIPNGLNRFLDDHPSIQTIAFNGQKAASLYKKYFKLRRDKLYLTLPSTSPANAGASLDQKKRAWLVLRSSLGLHA